MRLALSRGSELRWDLDEGHAFRPSMLRFLVDQVRMDSGEGAHLVNRGCDPPRLSLLSASQSLSCSRVTEYCPWNRETKVPDTSPVASVSSETFVRHWPAFDSKSYNCSRTPRRGALPSCERDRSTTTAIDRDIV